MRGERMSAEEEEGAEGRGEQPENDADEKYRVGLQAGLHQTKGLTAKGEVKRDRKREGR